MEEAAEVPAEVLPDPSAARLAGCCGTGPARPAGSAAAWPGRTTFGDDGRDAEDGTGQGIGSDADMLLVLLTSRTTTSPAQGDATLTTRGVPPGPRRGR